MYRGFKIFPLSLESQEHFLAGNVMRQSAQSLINSELERYLSDNGSLDGRKLETDWFPQIKADVFISHSHADEKLALSLASWLHVTFGLTVFVDSAIWGCGDLLLKKIDNEYCLFPDKLQYDYEKRNKSTSLIHVVLATAIAKMVNKTECLFFLGTTNSITSDSAVNKPETNSPWLYYELALSLLIRKPLSAHRSRLDLLKSRTFSETQFLNEVKNLDVQLPLTVEHLSNIDGNDLATWEKSYNATLEGNGNPLDELYELF